MSVTQYQSQLNRIDKEIVDLEKKRAEEDKKAAESESKALKINISKSASQSTINSKLRQINQYKEKATKSRSKSAYYSKKITEKSKKRNEVYNKLQKAELYIKKNETKESLKVQQAYENKINELEKEVFRKIESNSILTSDKKKYDVFISHASEDKEDFVIELVEELTKNGVLVWYDDKDTKWGYSLREDIDRCLRLSKYGIVVLSPFYIAEGKYWTKKELNGLFQMESINDGRILPIWHNLTKKEVAWYSPMIADKKAMTTANFTPKEIAQELSKILTIDNEKSK